MGWLEDSDRITNEFAAAITNPIIPQVGERLFVGVDLGTAYIVICVLDSNRKPIAGAYRYANVVKDGLVVDYLGALTIVKKLKEEIEEKIGCELTSAAVAIPPGTQIKDMRYIKNVAEGAGFEVTNIVDEPTAANAVLGIEDGVVVDIGGGTTGLAIIKNGKIVAVADEATGGTQCTLVVAGTYKISFDEAEILKQDPEKQVEISNILKPVAQKIAAIIQKNTCEYDVSEIILVGGTSALLNIEKVIEKELKLKTSKPENPRFVTPIGIAMNCFKEEVFMENGN